MSHPTDSEFSMTVVGREAAADGVVLIELASIDGSRLPAWAPGAHIDVAIPGGDLRQYSLCGTPGADTWRIGVLREPNGRGGSEWLHTSVSVGDELRISGPRNHFEFEPARGTNYLFIAGGIGITPISAMANFAAKAGVEYSVHYAGRSLSTMALVDELADAHSGRVSLYPADEGTRLDLDALVAALRPFSVIYCCGPTRLIEAVEKASVGRQLHVERFEPKELGEPIMHESFEVELALSELTLTVPPDRSILEVVEEAGVLVLSSCQEGTCGTCETPVLEGEVDHRDSILTPDEQASNSLMYICVSRAACPRLVLEL
jgi:ferredoxin-NADP reductase